MGTVTKPYTFANNTKADPTQVNNNFDTLYTLVNGNLDGTNVPLVATLQADVAQRSVNVKSAPFNAKGDGVTDDTAAIQAAIDHANTLYGGDTSVTAGYVGWYETEVIFPPGTYLCGLITVPAHVKLRGIGQSVIQSATGTSAVPAGKFIDNTSGDTIGNIYVERLTFLFFDKVFTLQTGNSDFSFMTFDQCKFAHCNIGIDTVSYALSRSTTFRMTRCTVTYGVTTLCKVYTDKSYFEGNWFNHSVDSIFMYLDSYAAFKDNVWVPTVAGANKAYISFSGSDEYRNLKFISERFGSEDGHCPIVIVGNVNANNVANSYRMQGISFEDCFMSSNSSYNPDGVTAVRACVILRPTLTPLNTINFISFKECNFKPDLTGGVVQTYNVSDITILVDSDFTIDFDYASAVSASKGNNIPSSADLAQYVKTPILHRKTSLLSKGSGKIPVVDTATTGVKKATFQIDRSWPNAQHTPIAFLVTTIGQGDTSFPNLAYAYMSVYILTISGQDTAAIESKIAYTKLHGTVGGASLGANADIVSAFWGTGDSGSDTQALTGTETEFDVTITFGVRVAIGSVYVQPLYDFSLLT